jgi:DMSO/TMAO reductase YedYZ molybdopterin-dependent catalytic subunit
MKRRSQHKIDRRTFLVAAGGTLTGIVILPSLTGCESHSIEPLVKPRPQPFITPAQSFFVQNGGEGAIKGWSQPVYGAVDEWSLTIRNGNTPLDTLHFNDILAVAEDPSNRITILKTIQCVLQSEVRVNPVGFSGNAYWTGVSLRQVLENAGLDTSPASPAKRLVFTGEDGFTNNITMKRLRGEDQESVGLIEPLLVYQMNGADLSPDHGWPVRLIIHEGYGYKNVKWLKDIQAVNFDVEVGTYQENGYVDDGIQRVNSRGTSLFDRIEVPEGPSTIYGFSLSGYAPIEKVEVSIDGTGGEAELISLAELREDSTIPDDILQLTSNTPYPYMGVWTPWRYDWDAQPGSHTVEIKATDGNGNVQPEDDTKIDDGQNGVTRYRIEVV